MRTLSWRRRLHADLEPTPRTLARLSGANRLVCALILVSAGLAILETEPAVLAGRERLFRHLEDAIALLFLLEYGLRLWVAVEQPRYAHPVTGRLRYLVSAPALMDLVALLPALLLVSGSEAFLLRLVRLLRILRLARLGRFSRSARLVFAAIGARRHELLVTILVALALLVASSTLMYLAEGAVQPETFGSIPRAMWWSVVTLTTVGYGDVFPVTVPGKLLAGATAVLGIGLIAMPTGILAAAFSNAMVRARARGGMTPGDGEGSDG